MGINKHNLDKAEQQILGFYHCYQGFDLESLCESMGLEKEEYEAMLKAGMLDYLPQNLSDEILEYLNKKQ